MILALKLGKFLLDKDKSTKTSEYFETITLKNVTTYYSLANLYQLYNVAEQTLAYIERCFQMVADTENFLHLNFSLVAKILASSELNLHSEVEVFNAANSWLKHNSEERSKHAIELLSKVRLTLLSKDALRHLLNTNSSFKKRVCVGKLN